MSIRLTGDVDQATCEDTDGRGGLAIVLSQPVNALGRWRFRVRAQTDEGTFHVGTFTSSPPLRDGPPTQPQLVLSRVIAIANCPGATNWTVDIVPVAGFDEAIVLEDGTNVSLAVGWPCGEAVGLQRVNERYKYYTGVDGTVDVLAGEVVMGWSAHATVAASVQINGLEPPASPAIPIPAGISVAGDPHGYLQGPVSFVFTDTDAFFIEVLESA